MHDNNILSLTTWAEIEPELRKQVADANAAQTSLLAEHPDLQLEEREDAEMEGLRAQRAALTTMLSNGLISEQVHEELIEEVDARIARAPRDYRARRRAANELRIEILNYFRGGQIGKSAVVTKPVVKKDFRAF